jgi:hypothetical protein
MVAQWRSAYEFNKLKPIFEREKVVMDNGCGGLSII